ncbi:hypothetical protein TNCV_3586551 [Trichonephila clavipes]|nr:hypothetical protein TNCV_3586551 [Trichonephila clavipes]
MRSIANSSRAVLHCEVHFPRPHSLMSSSLRATGGLPYTDTQTVEIKVFPLVWCGSKESRVLAQLPPSLLTGVRNCGYGHAIVTIPSRVRALVSLNTHRVEGTDER